MNAHVEQFVLAGHDFSQLGLERTIAHTLESLPVDTIAAMPWLHAASMVRPPTNRWFSGLAFGSPAPVFPMPYSYIQTDQGFVFGLPHVTSTRHSVTGPVSADLDINVGACSYRIASHDLASVTIEFMNEIGRVLGRAVLAEGVPYISYTAEVAHDVGVSEPFSMTYESCATAHVEGRHYGLVTTGAFSARSIRLQPGQYVSLIAFPDFAQVNAAAVEREISRIARHATYPVIRTEVTARVVDDHVSTSIRYVAQENGPVAVVRMAHHGPTPDADVMGTYTTVSGTFELVSSKVLEWSTPKVTPRMRLDSSGFTPEQRKLIAENIALELAQEARSPEDTYFAGKAFYRDANLLSIAEQLEVAGSQEFGQELEARFLQWFRPGVAGEPRSFFFDDVWSGVVGREASFGADMFNDHHFHWGYFLHTATTLVARNPELLDSLRAGIDALAFDIATPIASADVPLLRVFDAYKGHSWASGCAQFDEGNNQESSSEAVNAWNALGCWAEVSGQPWLYDLATWLLSLEAASARAYWTNFDESDPVRSGYQHSIVPLVWSAKNDYATWFSGEKSAMLGIVLLPMSPVANYLAGDDDRIMRNLEEVTGYFDDYDQTYGDYLLMYRALAGEEAAQRAWELAARLSPQFVDDGNSKAYTLAWIAERLV